MKRRLAIVSLVVCGAAVATAATNDLMVARHALRDELWEVARRHAAAAGTNEESRLIILESYAREGRWNDVKKALSLWPGEGGDGIEYYRAVARGDHAAAAKILGRGGSKEGLVAVRLFEADALAKAGDRAGAERLWRDIAASSNVHAKALAAASVNLMEIGRAHV